MILWLERVLHVCYEKNVAPRDFWVPLYKGKGDKCECNSYRCTSLMSVVGIKYGRRLINWVRKGTQATMSEQCGHKKGRGCVDQIFVVEQLCEKFLAKGKEVYFEFMGI